MITIDGPRRCVYIKFHSSDWPYAVLQTTEGCVEFLHDNGELSLVNISLTGIGIRHIRLAGLAPEVKEKTIREALSPYGDVRDVYEETWSKEYPYQVYNGVRIAMTNLKKHLPSRMIIAGSRAVISYEGQPHTCCGCNEQGHIKQDCPCRRQIETIRDDIHKPTWANIVTQRPMRQQMETMRDTVPTEQNHHEVDLIDVLNVIQPRQVDSPTSVNTADEETKIDTQTLDRDIPQPQQGIGQAIEGEEMNDLPLDTENSKTHNNDVCWHTSTGHTQ